MINYVKWKEYLTKCTSSSSWWCQCIMDEKKKCGSNSLLLCVYIFFVLFLWMHLNIINWCNTVDGQKRWLKHKGSFKSLLYLLLLMQAKKKLMMVFSKASCANFNESVYKIHCLNIPFIHFALSILDILKSDMQEKNEGKHFECSLLKVNSLEVNLLFFTVFSLRFSNNWSN